MQEQLTQLYAEIDAETFWRRVEVIRTTHTAPGTSDDAEPPLTGGGPSPFLASRKMVRGGSGVGGSGAADGAFIRELNKTSRYRHRDMMEYNDVYNIPWPTGIESVQGVRLGAQESSGGTDGVGRVEGSCVNPGVRTAFPVCHQFAVPLPLEARMSFTILNLTGQRMRYFQPRAGSETRYLRYLRVRVERIPVWNVTRKCHHSATLVSLSSHVLINISYVILPCPAVEIVDGPLPNVECCQYCGMRIAHWYSFIVSFDLVRSWQMTGQFILHTARNV